MFCQHSNILAPSKEILRIARLKCVKGSILQQVCSHSGNTEMEKKVPDNNICGKLKIFISKGIIVSFFTMLEKISPTPISINKNKILNETISINVINPCASVKLMQKCPTVISTNTFIN